MIKLTSKPEAIMFVLAKIGIKKPKKKNPELFNKTIFSISLKSGVKRSVSTLNSFKFNQRQSLENYIIKLI